MCLSRLTPVNSVIFPQWFFFNPGYLTWPIECRRRSSYYDIRPAQFHRRWAWWVLFSSFRPRWEALWDSSIRWLALGDKLHLVGMPVCVSEYVHACLAGFDVGVLSGVYHGGPMAVMNLLGQRLCVCVCCIRSFLGGKWTFEERRVLIWEPHQLGVKRCQPLGQILSNSPLLYNRNGIDLQISSRVHSNTPLQGRCCLVFCTWVRCGASIYFGRGCGQNTGVLSWAVCCGNKPVCLKVSRDVILYLLNQIHVKADMSYEQLSTLLILQQHKHWEISYIQANYWQLNSKVAKRSDSADDCIYMHLHANERNCQIRKWYRSEWLSDHNVQLWPWICFIFRHALIPGNYDRCVGVQMWTLGHFNPQFKTESWTLVFFHSTNPRETGAAIHSDTTDVCPSEVCNALCDSSSGEHESLTLTDSNRDHAHAFGTWVLWVLAVERVLHVVVRHLHLLLSPDAHQLLVVQVSNLLQNTFKRGDQINKDRWMHDLSGACGRKISWSMLNTGSEGKLRDQGGKKEHWERKMRRMLVMVSLFAKWPHCPWYLIKFLKGIFLKSLYVSEQSWSDIIKWQNLSWVFHT